MINPQKLPDPGSFVCFSSSELSYSSASKATEAAQAAKAPVTSENIRQVSQTELYTLEEFDAKYPKRKGRPDTKLTADQLKDAMAICSLDMGKQGIINRTQCPIHGKKHLVYNWMGPVEGVRVRCDAPEGCTRLNTHFEPVLFHNEVVTEGHGAAETEIE
jgi:hypothetical protein